MSLRSALFLLPFNYLLMFRPTILQPDQEQGIFFPELDAGPAVKSKGLAKNFVLDTNVLLHDPHCLNRFQNNHVFIPVEVLSELDNFKNEQSERGANARRAHRFFSQIFGQDSKTVTEGAPTVGGGSVRILVGDASDTKRPSAAMKRFHKIFPDQSRMDTRIIGACLALQQRANEQTILVTKDINMQLRAMAIGVQCEDYLSDKVAERDVEEGELREIEIEPHELQRFGSSGEIEVPAERTGRLEVNEYVLFQTTGGKHLPARHMGEGTFSRLNIPASIQIPKGIELRPANPGQQCFLDALLDPSIALITCYGQAGTGKTLLAVAAGLYLTGRHDFNGMTVSRPVVAMGDTLGFLPGTLNEKMHPWLQSIYDACEVLMPFRPPNQGKNRKQEMPKHKPEPTPNHPMVKPYEQLIERGLLEIDAL